MKTKSKPMNPKATPKTATKPKATRPAAPSPNLGTVPAVAYLPFDVRALYCKAPAEETKYESFDQEIQAAFASDEDAIRLLVRLRGSLNVAVADVLEEFDEELGMVARMRKCNHPNAAGKYRDLALRLGKVTTYLNEL